MGRVCSRAGKDGHDVTAYNLGVRRQTSTQVAKRLRREAVPRLSEGDGQGIVLAMGVNDTTVEDGNRRVPLPETLAALNTSAGEAVHRGWSVLVVGPAFVGEKQQNQRIDALSAAMGERCADLNIPFVNVVASLRGGENWERQVNAVDGAHPSASGYQQLTDTIWPPFSAWLRRIENDTYGGP